MLIRRVDASSFRLVPLGMGGLELAPAYQAVEPEAVLAPNEAASPADAGPDLIGRIEALEDELASGRAAAKREAEEAFLKGVEKGRHEAEDREAERLAALQAGLSAAAATWATTLEARSDLAVVIARAAICKILGEASARAAMVEDVVRHAVGSLFAGEVIQARLSAEDFPSPDSLAALGQAFGEVSFVREADLPAGSCLLELKLGTVDASLPVQAAAMEAELSRVASDPATGG